MKIATNVPEAFSANRGYDFSRLGDKKSLDSSIIILALEKNWGSSSVDRIKSLTHWISMFPKSVPCYIVGCETTIPSKSIEDGLLLNYRDNLRDNAIRELCDEVLSRSKSIGVREEITYAHLTQIIGYEASKIELIYSTGKNDNLARLRTFLKNNNEILSAFELDLLKFQEKPFVIYDKPINSSNDIKLSTPFVTKNEGIVRLSASITIDNESRDLWCETSTIYEQFLLSERADAFVCATLPFALRTGKNIICEAPISEQLLHNINEVLVPNLCAADPRVYKIKVIAPSDSSSIICEKGVATGMSCGVDSFYTVNEYINPSLKSLKLTHLYCGNYLYGNDGQIYDRATQVADDLELPLIKTTTNINDFFKLPHLYTHFFKTMFGVLSLRKLFRIYYYSSTENFSTFNLKDNSIRDTSSFELLLLYTFSSPDFQIMTGGGGVTRLEKTRKICNFNTANNYLNVCLYPNRDTNCGKCAKCLRTLLTLDMLGSLGKFTEVFDIKHYYENRITAFKYLTQQKNSKMLASVYEHFSKMEPVEMKKAKSIT